MTTDHCCQCRRKLRNVLPDPLESEPDDFYIALYHPEDLRLDGLKLCMACCKEFSPEWNALSRADGRYWPPIMEKLLLCFIFVKDRIA